MNIEQRASEMKRGLRFFNRVVYVVTLIALLTTILAVWKTFTVLWLTNGALIPALLTLLAATLQVGPYWLLAWGLRHVRNLFIAMNNALDELRTTV